MFMSEKSENQKELISPSKFGNFGEKNFHFNGFHKFFCFLAKTFLEVV